jgi:uncharacterized protein YciI
MLIAISKYTKPLSEVDRHRPAHLQHIKSLIATGELFITGRQNPPLGGVIISKTRSLAAFKKILDDDPFTKAGVAEYKITEFTPTLYDPVLNDILGK